VKVELLIEGRVAAKHLPQLFGVLEMAKGTLDPEMRVCD
jgi:hypothetical protein